MATLRRHEIGVRMALGATGRDIYRLIVGREMLPVVVGVGLGLGAAFGLTRLIASILYRVSPSDPATFGTVALVLIAVALLASSLPAFRRSRRRVAAGFSRCASAMAAPATSCAPLSPPSPTFRADARPLGPQAVAIETALGEARSADTRVRLVERFLLAQLARYYKPDVDRLASALWQRPGSRRVADLCRDLGVGERRLERTARAALGLSPKQAMSLARFLRACALLRRGAPESLADVAQVCGYYDQAHFHGDFKRLSGMTPLQFVADRAVAVLDPG